MSVTDLEKDCESICNDPLTPPRRPLRDFVNEYNKICEQIMALEDQIGMLDKNRQQLKMAAFDLHIQQLCVESCKLKAKIEPITLLLCEVISKAALEEDKEYFIEHIFLRRSLREIAKSHNTTTHSVLFSVDRCSKIQIPESTVEKYGEILKK